LASGKRRNTFCQLAAAAWWPSSTTVGRAGELLDVGDHEVALRAVVQVGVVAIEDGEVGALGKIAENPCLGPEALATSDVQSPGDPLPDGQVWSDDQHATRPDPEGKGRHDPGLAAPDGNLEDRRCVASGEVLPNLPVRLTLRLTEEVVRLDVGVRRLEELAGVVLRLGSPILEPEWFEVGAPVVAVSVSGLPDGGEPSLRVPATQGLRRDPHVVGGLPDPKELIS
jgi:hypothetical protein